MKPRWKIAFTTLLSGVSAWGAWNLALLPDSAADISRDRSGQSHDRPAHSSSQAAPVARETPEMVLSRLVASYSDEDLWECLEEDLSQDYGLKVRIAGELMDRLGGPAAMTRAMSIGDERRRSAALYQIDHEWCRRDPWAVKAMAQQYGPGFPDSWIDYTVPAAAKISADRLIEEYSAAPHPPQQVQVGEVSPDFDFKKAADFFASGKPIPRDVISSLESKWVARNPSAAVEWWLAHRSASDEAHGLYPSSLIFDLMKAPDPKAALSEMTKGLSEEESGKVWEELAIHSSAGVSVEVDLKYLSAATIMGQSDTYLANSLLGTRG